MTLTQLVLHIGIFLSNLSCNSIATQVAQTIVSESWGVILHGAIYESNLQRLSSYLGRGRLDSSYFVNIARQVAAEAMLREATGVQVAAIVLSATL